MNRTATAIYENGVLRPLSALDLPEHSEVEITIGEIHTKGKTLGQEVDKALGPLSIRLAYDVGSVSLERRAELADIFSNETPLSDYIRDDRDAR